MNILAIFAALVIDSSGFASCSGQAGGSNNSNNSTSSNASKLQISANNTILQNLYALSLNQSYYSLSNSSLSYISLLLGLNSSCTTNVTQILNSTSGNYTFFAPSDQAFRSIQGFPDFGSDFCQNCNESGSNSNSTNSRGGGIISRMFQSDSSGQQGQCPRGCNETSLAYNATSSQLMPCLPQMLQYHLLNESLSFNSTSFGFLNRSLFNLTVLPTMLNSSCLVNLSNSTSGSSNNSSSIMPNNQVLVFNITNASNNSSSSNNSGNSGGSSSLASSPSNSTFGSSPFNVTILHGINQPANVTVFDIPSSNGILHIIDALLIPPANLTDTLLYTYSNHSSTTNNNNNSTTNSNSSSSSNSTALPSFLNQTDLEMYANMSGITVFLPNLNSTSGSSTNSTSNSTSTSSSFNITDYIFPTLLYNNRSFETIGNLTDGVFFQQNLTNLNGQNVTVLFGRNNAMRFNGSEVTESNILMKNGVLHLFQAPEGFLSQGNNTTGSESGSGSGSGAGGNSTSATAAGLGRILGQIM